MGKKETVRFRRSGFLSWPFLWERENKKKITPRHRRGAVVAVRGDEAVKSVACVFWQRVRRVHPFRVIVIGWLAAPSISLIDGRQ